MTQHRKIRRSSIERFPDMLRVLKVNKGHSPNMISRKIRCDKRTVEKMLKTGIQLKMIKCENIKLDKRIYRSCKLSKKFKSIL